VLLLGLGLYWAVQGLNERQTIIRQRERQIERLEHVVQTERIEATQNNEVLETVTVKPSGERVEQRRIREVGTRVADRKVEVVTKIQVAEKEKEVTYVRPIYSRFSLGVSFGGPVHGVRDLWEPSRVGGLPFVSAGIRVFQGSWIEAGYGIKDRSLKLGLRMEF
jgi:hypothetical protein